MERIWCQGYYSTLAGKSYGEQSHLVSDSVAYIWYSQLLLQSYMELLADAQDGSECFCRWIAMVKISVVSLFEGFFIVL